MWHPFGFKRVWAMVDWHKKPSGKAWRSLLDAMKGEEFDPAYHRVRVYYSMDFAEESLTHMCHVLTAEYIYK